MNEYLVTCPVTFSITVYAEDEEEASSLAESECPFAFDSSPEIELVREDVPKEEWW